MIGTHTHTILMHLTINITIERSRGQYSRPQGVKNIKRERELSLKNKLNFKAKYYYLIVGRCTQQKERERERGKEGEQ